MSKHLSVWAFTLALLLPALALAGAPKVRITASSTRTTSDEDFGPSKAFDGLLNTSWGEDAPGLGTGEWIEIDLGEEIAIESVTIWGGHFAGREAWNARGRVAEMTILAKDSKGEVSATRSPTLGDRFARKDVTINAPAARTLRFTVDEVHEGAVFADLHISEIAFEFGTKPDPAWMEEINTVIDKSRTLKEKPVEARAALESAYTNCKAEEDYSRNFKHIGWYSVRGPEYMVELVQKYVPPGHRLKVLQFNEDAFDLLGRLKDANAIPYLEIAAAGARKRSDREWLMGTVAFFEAYQDLRRNPRATVPNWGSTGMEKGALMGRGEPVSISTDSYGNIWIADTGNNRVQRFTPAGTPDLLIGGEERAIVETWFGDEETPYASGSKADKSASMFQQPVFVSVGNYNFVMVIDADMRVQVFDEEGAFQSQWTVDTHWRPRAGNGNGTPIITWYEEDFYILIQDEVFIYSPTGDLKHRYNLEGGVVQAAVIAAGGKLLVRHVGSHELTEYKPEDGFRQGAWLRKPVEDDGSEDWDMATDARDNVYVVTDAGNLYKWNKKAKFIEKLQVFENPRNMPRIAVFDTLIYVCAKDTITRIVQEK
jgi:hypothetical protein